ncbi:YutD family protein [Holzapfeliella sp. JNUCC 80]
MKDEKEKEKVKQRYHKLARVERQSDDKLKIEDAIYDITMNYNDALDVELLKERFDPFLLKYDYIVGDIADDKLRFKGFFVGKKRRAHLDQYANTIEDYLMEYVNPGAAYFVLEKTGIVKQKLKVKQSKFYRTKNKKTQPQKNFVLRKRERL